MEIDDLGGNLPPEQEHDESWDETSVYEADHIQHLSRCRATNSLRDSEQLLVL